MGMVIIMKSKGFTLTELIAVIAIVGLLAIIATTAVVPYIKKAKESAAQTTYENLLDAAITYAEDKVTIPMSCAIEYEVDDTHSFSKPSSCSLTADNFEVTVSDLISLGYFKDDAENVDKNGKVIVYKYKSKKSKSFLECYNSSGNFIDSSDCYNYDIKAYAKRSLVSN